MLLVCLGLLGRWTVRVVRYVGWRLHEPVVPAFGSVEVAYFYEPGCPACLRARPLLDRLQQRYPQYRWARVDLSYPRGMELAEAYYLHGRVPVRSRGAIPAVFAGVRSFIGYLEIRDKLPAYLAEKAALGSRLSALGRTKPASSRLATRDAPAFAESREPRAESASAASIRERFLSFRLAPVLLAGLVDSVNPCAIATLIFFLSYLAFTGRRPRELLGVGAAFTAGVFITYFLIGLGLLRVLHAFSATTTLARWVYPFTGVATLALAGISFRDYLKARRGETSAMTLQMPRRLKRWTHQVIRTQMSPGSECAYAPAIGAGRLAGAAFATAAVISALEFTCSSQVYLPTLIYMTQVEEHRLRATWLLLLYNAMFVAPLVALFLLSSLGASSRSLGAFFVRRTAAIKLVMTFLLAGFSLYILAISAQMLRPL
jgi:cytochrome c biogenesis protein CcdA